MDNKIYNEIKKWETKVFYPKERFKNETIESFPDINKYLLESRERFVIISAETEAVVYKIGRHFIESGVPMRAFKFIDGESLGIMIDVKTNYLQDFKDYINNIHQEIRNKWVLIPEINCEWSKQYVVHFLNLLQKYGATGLIFYSDKNIRANTLGSVLCSETMYNNVYEYPTEKYNHKRIVKELPEDKY